MKYKVTLEVDNIYEAIEILSGKTLPKTHNNMNAYKELGLTGKNYVKGEWDNIEYGKGTISRYDPEILRFLNGHILTAQDPSIIAVNIIEQI